MTFFPCFGKGFVSFLQTAGARGELRQKQKVNLYLLKNPAEICDKNNLRYRLRDGTLLGALRILFQIARRQRCVHTVHRGDFFNPAARKIALT